MPNTEVPAAVSAVEPLRSVLDRRDAAAFTGRVYELRCLEAVLAPESTCQVGIVHGPGGIGKSALLRELARRARSLGYRVRRVDGRSSDAADEVLAAVSRMQGRTLLVVDTYEAIRAIDLQLRERLMDELPRAGRVVIAGRTRPAPAWTRPPWGAKPLHLGPLARDEAADLLRRRGREAPESVLDWARGEPLALSVASEAIGGGRDLDPVRVSGDQGIARVLMERLAGEETDGPRREVLVAAVMARAVDAPTLEALSPALDGEEAEQWLRRLSFTEELDGRVAVHTRIREAVRTVVRSEDPAHHRDLRRRLVDHLCARARAGDYRLVPEMAELVDDPRIRWGLGVEQAATHRADHVRDGDEEAVAAVVEPTQPRRWALLRRWFHRSPDHIVAVRDRDGELSGVGIYVTVEDAPRWADDDPVLAAWLPHARRAGGSALINRGGVPVRWTPGRAAVGNSVLMARRERDLRRVYGVGYRHNPDQVAFLAAMGYRHMRPLDVVDGEQPVESHVLDLEDGIASHVRDLVYRDLGILTAAVPDLVSAVRDALRAYHDDPVLAASTLARGGSVEGRAASVRELLEDGVASAFGESADERLLQAILERGYMSPGRTHEETARTLHLSRSTYFRRLGRAVERLAVYLDQSR